MPICAAKLTDKLETAFAYTDSLGSGGNLAGLPALSMPCGFSKGGLPIGIQVVGRPWDEERILARGPLWTDNGLRASARLYQETTDWHRRRPPLVPPRSA